MLPVPGSYQGGQIVSPTELNQRYVKPSQAVISYFVVAASSRTNGRA